MDASNSLVYILIAFYYRSFGSGAVSIAVVARERVGMGKSKRPLTQNGAFSVLFIFNGYI